jgi:hypothetical protein
MARRFLAVGASAVLGLSLGISLLVLGMVQQMTRPGTGASEPVPAKVQPVDLNALESAAVDVIYRRHYALPETAVAGDPFRRPAAPVAAASVKAPDKVPPPLFVKLSGFAEGDGARAAFLDIDGKRVAVRAGDTFLNGRVRVVRLGPAGVVLRIDGETVLIRRSE